VDIMNFACDLDLFRGWAEAVCHGRISQKIERKYNAASLFKRAQGQGRIRGSRCLGTAPRRVRPYIPVVDLLPLGAPRRDWQQTLISDGMVIVRHPDLARAIEIADRVATELQLVAG
jgi:hypothetical protein